ncbi:MAG TPA: tetratricopeptide repeat protein [Thermoanaerobaculia bacterium]|nr:tetratricopeptide repeat protein [Thermoanaerobaculia bacterium]
MTAQPSPAAAGPDPQATRTNPAGAGCLEAGSLIAGRYRILSLAGVGGMGMVYRAHDEQLGVDVALKVLRPEVAADPGFRERFRKELLLARQVSHRNAVRIHDLGSAGDLLFLTMDYIPGSSLRAVLEAEGRLPAGRAVAIARQLAAALAAAHAEGVVHRDLKPANVLVDAGGRAFITDFGVARSLAVAGPTQTGGIVGTPDYLSPEQARGEPVDGRSDVYALGLLLFEMLSGRLPFAGDSYAERLAQRIGGEARDLGELGVAVPARLRAVVRRCLQRNPARRYQSAADLLAGLDALPDFGTGAAAPPERHGGWLPGLGWRGLRGGLSRRWWSLGLPGRLSAAAALALLVLAAWMMVRALVRAPGPAARGAAGAGAANEALAGGAASVGGGGAPALATPRHVVAVLPLAEQTGRADLAWSSAGVAELLAAALAESPALRVVDSLRLLRTVEDLKLPRGPLPDAELRQLAELVEADRVVTGTVRAAGGLLRLDLALVAADLPRSAAPSLHAEARDASQIFQLVADLGERLRRQLEAGAAPPPGAAPAPLTASGPAMAAYAEGLGRLSRADSLGARPALERAVAADPAFTAAWVRLAACYQALGYAEKAQAAAARAAATPGAAAGRLGFAARAQLQQLQGAPEAAQETLRQLVKSYPHDLEARLALAEAYGQQGKLEEAVDALRQVVRADPNHPRGWFLLSRYLIEQGKARQAVDETLVHAMVVQNRLGSEQGRADALNALGVAYQQLGDLDRAADSYRQAAAIRRRIDDRRGYATSLKNLATLALVHGAYEEAERNLRQALEILQALGDRAGVAELENAFGGLEEERGRYDRALASYRQALQLRRDLGDRLALAESLGNVGFAYHLLGDYDNALVYWQQALSLNRATGDRAGVVTTTQSIGQLQLAQGKWTEALKSFLDTLAESRKLGLKAGAAVSTGYLGRVAQYQGRYQAALASYHDALGLVRELGDRRGETEFTLYEAEALQEIGMQAAAAGRLAQAAAWLHGSGAGGGGAPAAAAAGGGAAAAGGEGAGGSGEAAAGGEGSGGENAEQLSALESLRGKGLLLAGDAAAALAAFRLAEAQAVASHSLVARLQARVGRALAAAATAAAAAASRGGGRSLSGARSASAARATAGAGGSASWTELRAAAGEVERLGHLPLLLWAEQGMAAAALAAGDAAAAEEAAGRGLRLADRCGPYAGAYRLHLLLARALAARGAAAEAGAERRRAAQEAARVESGLTPEQRQAFARLPEVRDLGGHG